MVQAAHQPTRPLDDRAITPPSGSWRIAMKRPVVMRRLAGLLWIGVSVSFLVPARMLAAEGSLALATFSVEVTPPIGHPLLAGAVEPAKSVDDPLWLHGIIFLGAGQPIVWAGIDWCEIRNDAYDRWREALAEAAGTSLKRVLFSCLHQHDAPLADLTAERLCEEAHVAGGVCDLDFHEQTVRRAAQAVHAALSHARPFTQVGVGQAKVERVASTRRILGPDGKVAFIRNSSSTARGFAEPEGYIDPWLKTISFYSGDTPLVAVSCYATHPMSYYGHGGVSADFVGLARSLRQKETPGVRQIYLTGCGANITAGKYNDGSPANRAVLAERVHRAMVEAWDHTKRYPLKTIDFRLARLDLPPRQGEGYRLDDLRRRLHRKSDRAFDQIHAAMGLSWRMRLARGEKIDVPSIDFGVAQVVLLPGETFVEYQLLAQQMRPDKFVMTVAYADAAPGYIPLDKNFDEGGHDLDSWCWVAPGVEGPMRAALSEVLQPAETNEPEK